VLGASGVVGHIAVQPAKLLGAGHVVAAARLRDLHGRTLIGYSNEQAPLEVRRQAYQDMAARAAAGEIYIEVERLPLSRIEETWERQARGPHRRSPSCREPRRPCDSDRAS
jgi:D-arabinose 1-dehydrogenase-like Zn-dependent alcohol dehydrogenase